ncbi:MAG: hypothetical protein K8H86_02065 [Ignavibacteriaceae bacterium]|nr:hypothetical protein [Ignavibacteriaceae bacterium]
MLEEFIKNISLLLDDVINCLNDLNEDNFDELYPRVVIDMKEVHAIKQMLQSKYNGDDLMIFNIELLEKTKLIQTKFDNIIEYKEKEQADILMQLQKMQNNRKLANYR